MLKKKMAVVAALLLASAAFTACEKDWEGNDELIRFTVNGEACPRMTHTEKGYSLTYKVPAGGGAFDIASSNYGFSFIPCEIYDGDKNIWTEYYWSWEDNFMHLEGEWYDIQYDAYGIVKAVVKPKPVDAPPRSLTFVIAACCTRGIFVLQQE